MLEKLTGCPTVCLYICLSIYLSTFHTLQVVVEDAWMQTFESTQKVKKLTAS